MKRRHYGQHDGDSCFPCKLTGIQLSPAATPTRRNSKPPTVNESANAWERGIVRDERGMPLLGPNGEVGVKEYANNRSKYEEAERRLAHEAALSN